MTIHHGGNVFAVARQRGWDWREMADFSASINPLGASPLVREAIVKAIDAIEHYPERYADSLRNRLAEEWSIDPERILLGNGATELIHFFSRNVRQSAVTLAVPTFSEFHRAFPQATHVPAAVPSQWPTDGLLVFTQPNNPLGTSVDFELVSQRPGPVFVDESFLEFTSLPSVMHRAGAIFVLRSLTKFYALPGLRIGALIGPKTVIQDLARDREPWQVNVLAIAAAMAALEDTEHYSRTRTVVAAERDWLFEAGAKLTGVEVYPSCANYLFATLAYSAAPLCEYLLKRKILIRDCSSEPGVMRSSVRFAVRTREDNVRLMSAWKDYQCEP